MEWRERAKDLMSKLAQERDELRLKVHLAKMDAQEEWDDLEGKWDKLKGKMKVVGDEAEDASEDVRAAAGKLADQLKDGYARLRKRI